MTIFNIVYRHISNLNIQGRQFFFANTVNFKRRKMWVTGTGICVKSEGLTHIQPSTGYKAVSYKQIGKMKNKIVRNRVERRLPDKKGKMWRHTVPTADIENSKIPMF